MPKLLPSLVVLLSCIACSSSTDTDDTQAAVCGNNLIEIGEECDDGNDADTDDCTTACTAPRCGDGFLQPGEACDDGNDDETDGCTSDCRASTCGDGIVQPGEACDDGNDDETDGCTSECRAPTCGDGIVQPGEACDDGNDINTDACTNNCLAPSCGDGFVQPGEACDDGNDVETDECTSDCRASSCGDGIVQSGEACDDGNGDNTDACTNDCIAAACGDGFMQPGEACDDGNDDNTDSCTNDCLAAACGDGFVQPDEACDDGNDDDTDACTNDCLAAACGDGFVQPGEACDDGNDDETDECTSDCRAPSCGDGYVQPGEECDDANDDNTDSCTSGCLAPSCGDGFVQFGEECDDGNEIDTDSCTTACMAPRCGDGFVHPGEVCDDGNLNDADGCTTTCSLVYTFTTAGTIGRQGPTQAALDTAYAGTTLASAVTATTTGIQTWSVPASGTYRISALGASGYSRTRSAGAAIAGDFDLVAGDKLYILVGQVGGILPQGTHYYHSPGGGGSFVAMGPTLESTTPLIVAGGGGGTHPSKLSLHAPEATCGSTTPAGNDGYVSVRGGIDGSWGGASSGMDRAAGFYSATSDSSASAFQDGGLGALAGLGVPGGFGGGAALQATSAPYLDFATAGGGGGFSGGASATMGINYSHPAGGGGSFNGGRNRTSLACANETASGSVEIAALTLAAADGIAPTPGSNITVGAVTGTSVTLAWDAATDDLTPTDDLQYTVAYSTTNDLGTTVDALANGTIALRWSRAVPPTFTVTRLAGNTTYHFAILVRDASGNVALYASGASATTKGAFTFTNAGASGRRGPEQSAVDAAYAATSLASAVTVTATGIQRWTVPATGTYRIETHGAQGASDSPNHARGAQMRGTFSLTAGETLWILVGQQGVGIPGPYGRIGGGGGTFVARGGTLVASAPLIVAGGGGGSGFRDQFQVQLSQPDPVAGSTLTSGNPGEGGIAGGVDGTKGGVFTSANSRSDAAAGFFSGQGGVTSQAFQDGGLGALFSGVDGDGGFGGGGASITAFYAISGGGGGYSGGGSSEATNGFNYAGGGGGSFNGGTDQRNEWGGNAGHGKVVIIEQ